MDQTSEEIYSQYHGKLIRLVKNDGDQFIGFIMGAAGIQKANTLIPNTSFLTIDTIQDIESYKKGNPANSFQHKIVHPAEIEKILLFDILEKPVILSYSDFQQFNEGLHPTSKQEVIKGIQEYKTYLVILDGITFRVVIGKDEMLVLEEKNNHDLIYGR